MHRPDGIHANDPRNLAFRQLKESCGWPSVTIARRLDLTHGVISQYLHGHTRPSTLVLKAFERAIADERSGGMASAALSTEPFNAAGFAKVQPQMPAADDVAAALNEVKARAQALVGEIADIQKLLVPALGKMRRRKR